MSQNKNALPVNVHQKSYQPAVSTENRPKMSDKTTSINRITWLEWLNLNRSNWNFRGFTQKYRAEDSEKSVKMNRPSSNLLLLLYNLHCAFFFLRRNGVSKEAILQKISTLNDTIIPLIRIMMQHFRLYVLDSWYLVIYQTLKYSSYGG